MGLTRSFLKPRRLEENDDMQDFSCGVALIDDWAHGRALSAVKHGTAVPYISTTAEGEIAGFYTLSAYSVNRDSVLGGWLRRNTPDRIPAILIGMLGVDKRFQGDGLGWKLLQDAIMRARAISRQLGSRAVIVDPYDDSTRSFYEHFGFKPIPGSDGMYLRLV
ncbi:GNAT family N-acetyltransferase [Bifidobacterium saguinibicoloris]|uniref:GNAT family N-acetyltransferase n=1 Tax=Bifidobacterium saguinibicoloris TaxID=2834433 RepID=UPI001F2707BC|nr:GNAT family N-acetyltransferase [Bifidobacterium saguinibicoloris]